MERVEDPSRCFGPSPVEPDGKAAAESGFEAG